MWAIWRASSIPRTWCAATTTPLAEGARARRRCWRRWAARWASPPRWCPGSRWTGRRSAPRPFAAGCRQGDAARARALLGRPYLRQAAVAARRGGRWELFMPPNGKQDVPRGSYRTLCSDGEHTWPVLLRVEREGRALCGLPAGTALHDELDIRFLTGPVGGKLIWKGAVCVQKRNLWQEALYWVAAGGAADGGRLSALHQAGRHGHQRLRRGAPRHQRL